MVKLLVMEDVENRLNGIKEENITPASTWFSGPGAVAWNLVGEPEGHTANHRLLPPLEYERSDTHPHLLAKNGYVTNFESSLHIMAMDGCHTIDNVVFIDSNICFSGFERLIISNCTFINCNIFDSTYQNVSMYNTYFISCDLGHSYFKKFIFSGSCFIRCDISKSHFANAHIYKSIISSCILSETKWEQSCIKETSVKKSILYDQDFLSNIKIEDSEFNNCQGVLMNSTFIFDVIMFVSGDEKIYCICQGENITACQGPMRETIMNMSKYLIDEYAIYDKSKKEYGHLLYPESLEIEKMIDDSPDSDLLYAE